MYTNIINRIFPKGNSRSNIAKKNIIGSITIKGLSILVQLLLVPLTLGYLSTELYGVWLTVSSVLLWLNFFDVGFTLGLKNRLTEALATDDFVRGKHLVSTTYCILLIIFLSVGVIGEFIIPYIDWCRFLNIDKSFTIQIKEVIAVLFASVCLQMIFNTLSTILAAYQKVAISSIFPVIGNIASLIIIYFLSKFSRPSLLTYAISISYLPVVIYIISSIFLFSKTLKPVAPSFKYVDFSLCRDLLQLGLKFFIIQIQVIILFQSTNILISHLSSPQYVTYYNIAYRYISTISMFFTLSLGPLWPAFTDAYIKKDFVWMKNTYTKMCKIYFATFILVIVMVLISNPIYNLWIGDNISIPFTMTLLVGVYIAVNSWDSLQVYLLNGIGSVKLQTYVTLIGLFFHIPLSFLLGRTFNLDAYGVIISMITITGIYSIIFTTQIRKLLSNKSISNIWKA